MLVFPIWIWIALITTTRVSCVSVSVSNNQITCDGFVCPANTDNCAVSVKSDQASQTIITNLKCLSNGVTLTERTTSAPNPQNNIINSVSINSVSNNGDLVQQTFGGYNVDPNLAISIQQQVQQQLQSQFENAYYPQSYSNYPNYYTY